jgi:hypothetical protein
VRDDLRRLRGFFLLLVLDLLLEVAALELLEEEEEAFCFD